MNVRSSCKLLVSPLIFLLGCMLSYGQEPLESEKDLHKEAERLFREGKYTEAYPLFSQLLSIYPDNINYDYKFAVSMLYAEPEPEKAVPYLEYASSKPGCDKTIQYHLGKGYQYIYRFQDAINTFNRFKETASKKDSETLKIDLEIENCRHGLFYLRNIPSLSVVKKTEIRDDAFFKSYDMNLFSGKILVKPDDFRTETDKKKGEFSLIHLPASAGSVFFSSYGTTEGGGKDIYRVEKLGEGKWGSPVNLGNPVNTPEDEDFPFLHPDGQTLYFCSKGHKSIGGYDIYKSVLNTETGRWSEPVNLGFPINSPFDDILFLTTADNKYSSFSSRRYASPGSYNVFKIKVDEQLLAGVSASVPEIEAAAAEPMPALAAEVKQKAMLEVNAPDETATAREDLSIAVTEEPAVSPQPLTPEVRLETLKKLKPDELIDRAYENAKILEEDALKTEAEARSVFGMANEQRQLSVQKANEALEIRKNAETILDEPQKQAEIEKSKTVQQEADRISFQAEALASLSDTLTRHAAVKKEDGEKAKETARKVEQMVQSGNTSRQPYQLVSDLEASVEIQREKEASGVSPAESIVMVYEKNTKKLQADVEAEYEKAQYYSSEIRDIDDQIESMKTEIQQTKDKSIKEELTQQIAELENDKTELQTRSQQSSARAQQLERDVAVKQKQTAELLTAVNVVREKSGLPAISEPDVQPEVRPVTAAVTHEPETTAIESETVPLPSEKTTTMPASEEPVSESPYREEYTAAVLLENEAKAYRDSAKGASGKEKKKYEKAAEVKQKEAEKRYATAKDLQRQEMESEQEKTVTGTVHPTVEAETATPATGETMQPETSSPTGTTTTESKPPDIIVEPPSSSAIYSFKSPENAGSFETVTEYEDESNRLQGEAETLLSEASSSTDKNIKKTKTKEALALQKTSDEQLIKSSEEMAKVSRDEYRQNETELNATRSNAVQNLSDTMLARAINYESESRVDFEDAQNLRVKSAKVKDRNEKRQMLTDAKNLEMMALKKQSMAIDLYSGKIPEPIQPPVASIRKIAPPEQEPVAEESYKQPSLTEPVSPEPSASGTYPVPAVTESAAAEPVTTEPSALPPAGEEAGYGITYSEPSVTQPATEPSYTEPTTTQSATEPSYTEPTATQLATEPSYTEPTATQPATEPSYAEPTTIQPVTEPSYTEPSYAEPPSTEPLLAEPVVTGEPVTEPHVSGEAIYTSPAGELTGDLFVYSPTPAYSSAKPIPINAPIPAGVVFKVQVGAFRKSIRQDLFGGISPVTGETTPMGFKRYTAGMFKTFNPADEAKNKLHDLGFKDAFVVAYYNGRRITPAEARDLLEGRKTANDLAPEPSASISQPVFTGPPVNAGDMTSQPGIIFTVQVGAFSNPARGKMFSDLKSLYLSQTGSLYRYSTGIFTDIEQAKKERESVLMLGYMDAFVTAYRDGVRISIEEAKQLQGAVSYDATEEVAAPAEEKIESPSTVSEITDKMDMEETYISPSGEKIDLRNYSGNIMYRVLLGNFMSSEEIPVDVANGILSVSKMEKVETLVYPNDRKAFYAGKYVDFDSAERLKDLAREAGVKKAKVVAFAGDNEVPLDKAKDYSAKYSGEETMEQPYTQPAFEEPSVPVTTQPETTQPETTPVAPVESPAEMIPPPPADTYESIPETTVEPERREMADPSVVPNETLSTGTSPVDTRAYEENIATADDAFVAGDLNKAKLYYGFALTNDPNSQYARNRLAETERLMAEREVKFNDAMDAAAKAVAKKDYELAKAYYEQALTIKPNETSALDKIGEMDRLIAEREASVNRLIMEIQRSYEETGLLQEEAFALMKTARDTLGNFVHESAKPTRDTTISRGYYYVQGAIDRQTKAKEKHRAAKTLHDGLTKQLEDLGFKEEAVTTYLATIIPVVIREGLLDTISDKTIDGFRTQITDAYDNADFLQLILSRKIKRAWDTLHYITELDDPLREILDEAVASLEQPKFAFLKADEKYYSAKIRMILAGFTMQEIDRIIQQSAFYNASLFPQISGSEIDEVLAAVRSKFAQHRKNKDISDVRFGQARDLLAKAQQTLYPAEREQMVNEAKRLEEEGKEFKKQAAVDYMVTRDAYDIGRYKFLIGGIHEEDPDIQRLEYIIQ